MVMVIIGIVAGYSTVVSGRTEIAKEKVRVAGGDQYRTLVNDYAVERMMREVG